MAGVQLVPSSAEVLDPDPPVRTVVAHERDESSIILPHQAGLDVAKPDHEAAGRPGTATIVADRHDRGGKRVAVERQDPPARRQRDRVDPRHPAPGADRAGPANGPRTRQAPSGISVFSSPVSVSSAWAIAAANSVAAGVMCSTPDRDHFDRPGRSRRRFGHRVLEQGAFPPMVQDRRPEEPDRPARRPRTARDCSPGIPGYRPSGISAPKMTPPGQPRPLDHHVIGVPLATSRIPGRQQVAPRRLDHARCVIMLGSAGKMAWLMKFRRPHLSQSSRHDRNQAQNAEPPRVFRLFQPSTAFPAGHASSRLQRGVSLSRTSARTSRCRLATQGTRAIAGRAVRFTPSDERRAKRRCDRSHRSGQVLSILVILSRQLPPPFGDNHMSGSVVQPIEPPGRTSRGNGS